MQLKHRNKLKQRLCVYFTGAFTSTANDYIGSMWNKCRIVLPYESHAMIMWTDEFVAHRRMIIEIDQERAVRRNARAAYCLRTSRSNQTHIVQCWQRVGSLNHYITEFKIEWRRMHFFLQRALLGLKHKAFRYCWGDFTWRLVVTCK